MKQYLLFAGDNYHPYGGIDDYQGDFNTVEEAVKQFRSGYYDNCSSRKQYWDWYQVVKSEDMSFVTHGWA